MPASFSAQFYVQSRIETITVTADCSKQEIPSIKLTVGKNVIVIDREELGPLGYDDIALCRVFRTQGKNKEDLVYYIRLFKRNQEGTGYQSEVCFYFSQDKYLKRITALTGPDPIAKYRTKFKGESEKPGYR